MAERKTRPAPDEYRAVRADGSRGPWRGRPVDIEADYDAAINDGGDSVEEMLASARQFLAKPTVIGNIKKAEWAGHQNRAAEAQRRAEEGSTLLGELKQHPIETVKRGIMGAALPLSFAGGGIGAAASVPYVLEAGSNFAEDPSLMSAAMLALTALPGVQWARQAPKIAAPAITQAQWARKLRPSQVAEKAEQWTPKRPPPEPQFGGPANIRNSGQRPGFESRVESDPMSIQVMDDVPVQPANPVADDLNDLMRAGQAPLRRETARQQAAGRPMGPTTGQGPNPATSSNIVRQRGTADIEAEMRAAGASEKDIRQLYHSTQSQGRGVRAEGLPGQVGTGKRLSAEEKRIREILASMGMD